MPRAGARAAVVVSCNHLGIRAIFHRSSTLIFPFVPAASAAFDFAAAASSSACAFLSLSGSAYPFTERFSSLAPPPQPGAHGSASRMAVASRSIVDFFFIERTSAWQGRTRAGLEGPAREGGRRDQYWSAERT